MDECENVIEFEEFEALCDAACDNMVKKYIFNCSKKLIILFSIN